MSVGPPENFTGDITMMDNIVFMGGKLGEPPFALMQRGEEMWTIERTAAGRLVSLINKVIVSDNIKSKPSSGLVTIIIVVVAMVLIIVGLGVCLLRKLNSTKNNNSSLAPITEDHPAFKKKSNNVTYGRQGRRDNASTHHHQSAGNSPPTHILPLTPTPPTAQQQHMLGLQFSSHPRPSFVTTAHGAEEQTIVNASKPTSGAPGAPQTQWQPTPFVPPARTCDNNMSTSPPSTSPRNSPASPASSNAPAAASFLLDPQQVQFSPDANQRRLITSNKPLPSPPPILRITRPDPAVGSPHSLVITNNPQLC
ncbi:MAG: hypothetical protein J3R72DRAFT_456050, partial [Linnemannia gamsii]